MTERSAGAIAQQKWRERNPEKLRETRRAYYLKNAEKHREYQRRYRSANRVSINAREAEARRAKRAQKDHNYFEAETARSMGALRKVRADLDARDIRRAERREAEAAKRTRLASEVNMLQRATL